MSSQRVRLLASTLVFNFDRLWHSAGSCLIIITRRDRPPVLISNLHKSPSLHHAQHEFPSPNGGKCGVDSHTLPTRPTGSRGPRTRVHSTYGVDGTRSPCTKAKQ